MDSRLRNGLAVRRRALLVSLGLLSFLGLTELAQPAPSDGAAGQSAAAPQAPSPQYEELSQSTRTALTPALGNRAPPVPEFADTEARLAYLRWFGTMSGRLQNRAPDEQQRKDFLQTVWYESRRAGLDTALVLGVIESVSGFQKFYTDANDARGFMGVNATWADKIGDGDKEKLFDMQTNLRFGCVLLRHFIDRNKGDIFLALVEYSNENLGTSKGTLKAKFPNSVLGNAKKWVFADPSPAQAGNAATTDGKAKRGAYKQQGGDRLNEVIAGCVRTVRESGPADYSKSYWDGFDAFYNPATGRVENNAILVGQQPARFAFNKCMAGNGIPLTP